MSGSEHVDRDTAARYIRENFAPDDRLAVVLLNKRMDTVIQRLSTAERLATTDVQDWLQQQNNRRYDIYISMNALHSHAQGRTKADVAAIRHVYLDVDDNGTAAVEALLKREDLPKPNYLINSSPDKWQVVWKVDGFSKEQAEELQRALARETGADIAATDCARVLRLPGFYNHKYSKPFSVASQAYSQETYGPDRFPRLPEEGRGRPGVTDESSHSRVKRTLSTSLTQSERDWAYVKRALARGEPQDVIIAALVNRRRYDKHDPRYYAELTVRKAAEALNSERSAVQRNAQPER